MSETVDYFLVLGIARSAALDEDLVRTRFRDLSREVHPDSESGDEEKFAVLNEAQRVLRSPAARLRHLLELEHDGLERNGAMSEELMKLFADLSGIFSGADQLIAKRRAAGSAVERALLAKEEMSVQQSLMAAGGKLIARRREIEADLVAVELRDREAMQEAANELAFLEKWQRQVQERLGALIV